MRSKALNSVLDDNRLLTMPSGERIQLALSEPKSCDFCNVRLPSRTPEIEGFRR